MTGLGGKKRRPSTCKHASKPILSLTGWCVGSWAIQAMGVHPRIMTICPQVSWNQPCPEDHQGRDWLMGMASTTRTSEVASLPVQPVHHRNRRQMLGSPLRVGDAEQTAVRTRRRAGPGWGHELKLERGQQRLSSNEERKRRRQRYSQKRAAGRKAARSAAIAVRENLYVHAKDLLGRVRKHSLQYGRTHLDITPLCIAVIRN